ncbi:peptidase M23 [Patiriisocius marinistellae]|uniref:Peptidase M23 n=1 Tax=Patiriisocius marinistellae TaxID=2494560 RepID=A0A5J4FX62_9FLAO|nr:peptidoglycan DD-metalloendopeptidase family protein [Patiriisocius marinistellae]GEQ84716.1 peptidase M23 [Patiriisocius marinistellae]
MKYLLYILPAFLFLISCDDEITVDDSILPPLEKEIITEEYGYTLNDFNVVRDTIRNGDTFGGILNENGVSNAKIFEVATQFKDSFDVRRIVVGKPYVLLNSKDSLNSTQVFIYEKSKVDYAVIDFREDVSVNLFQKPIKYIEREASGIIESSLSLTMEENNLSPAMTERLANIYAWTVNFFKLQKGDRFKVVYTEKYINDTIPAGIDKIKAAYFEHKGVPLYAFGYMNDSLPVLDFYDEKAENLRRAFLKAPVKFSRISSKYNLKRRIKFYGYKLRPHKGTDFAASIGTPILATADGTVTKSERRGGNGNYVKIKHNSTYDTQYLHMKSRNVRVGDFVRQGDVIGWVGMTGNTGGPHVCYRFWKNGKQVDPFQEDLPASKPLPAEFHEDYFAKTNPMRTQLDCIKF